MELSEVIIIPPSLPACLSLLLLLLAIALRIHVIKSGLIWIIVWIFITGQTSLMALTNHNIQITVSLWPPTLTPPCSLSFF
jgi:hypothetical protein